MAEFETISSEKIEFNMGGEFLELSFNIVKSGKGETRYLRLARGFYDQEHGEPRYKRGGVTLPGDMEILGKLADAIKGLDLSPLQAGDESDDSKDSK